MAMLHVVTDEGDARQIGLTGDELLIGRHPHCDVVLRDTTVSRRHARVYRDGDSYFIEDLGSQHGTFVNGEAIGIPIRLFDQDELLIRKNRITFRDDQHTHTDLINKKDIERPSAILKTQSGVLSRDVIDEVNAGVKLRALLEITRTLGVSLNAKKIFPKILESIFRIFPQASRGYILVAEGSQGKLIPHAIKQLDSAKDEETPISFTIAQRVMENGEAILSSDASEDERFKASESIREFRFRSILCAPLMGMTDKPLGMIQINSENPRHQFRSEDLDVLVNVANLAGHAVEHARLHETQLHYDRRERDVQMAKQVQLHFLPQDRPQVDGYEFYDFYSAAEGVGGDYYGYIELPDGRLAIAMGDVAGKGVSAALLMARLCSDVRYCLVTHPTPADAMQALNKQLTSLVAYGRLVTFLLCVLDPNSHELVFVNAGHMPPVVRRAGTNQVEQVGQNESGPPLGVDAQRTYKQATISLNSGDSVLLYTDGVNEAPNVDGELYGTERICKTIQGALGAKSIVETLLADLRSYAHDMEQYDDTCLVCFSRNGE